MVICNLDKMFWNGGFIKMIKHVVCFKLKDNSEEMKQKTKEVLLSMKGKVGLLRGIEVGVDFLGSARSFDVILSVVLDDEAALNAYQQDKYHCEVVKTHMHAVMENSVSVDYYLDQ